MIFIKLIIITILILSFTNCTFFDRKIAQYKINNAEKLFLESGVSIESLNNVKEGLKKDPSSEFGIINFKKQYEYAQKNYINEIKKENTTLSTVEKYEILNLLENIYENFPEEIKKRLKIEKDKKFMYNDENFYKILKITFYSKTIEEYNRDELKRWYEIFKRNNNNSEIKKLEERVERELVINISVLLKNNFYFTFLDNPIDRAIRNIRGYRNGFCNFDGSYINSQTDVIIKIEIDRIEHYPYSNNIKENDGKKFQFEKRRFEVIGSYFIFDNKTSQILRKKRFSVREDYTLKKETDKKDYNENRLIERELNKRLERKFEELFKDIIREIKIIY